MKSQIYKFKTAAAESVRKTPWPLLILLAIGLALAPWPAGPEPHLVEKIRMLSEGNLRKPIDIFDLFMHSAGLVLVAIKLVLHRRISKSEPGD